MAITEALISKDNSAFEASVGGFVGTTTTTTTFSTTTLTTTTSTQTTFTESTTTQPPAITQPPEALLHPPRMPQANPTLDKISLLLNLSGSSQFSPILSGLAGAAVIQLEDGETVEQVMVIGDSGVMYPITFTELADGTIGISIVFGRDTDESDSGARNHLEVTTNLGIFRKQFWVKKLSLIDCLYISNQEAQASQARFRILEGQPISFSINILPNFADEFFRVHEFDQNRWANTLRSWGGAETAEVFLDSSLILSERNIALVNGYWWQSPDIGEHAVVVRLRASRGSSYKVDIHGSIFVSSETDPAGDT